ncbi:MAG: glutathione-dependent reductase [Hyphomicrobiales bacterium]|nr:MAG: glutathione-dependent reductase [Hyphomicrobiales bacterium]
MLVNGKWDADWHPIQKKDTAGRFVRQTSSFRDWITPDASENNSEVSYPAEAGRYHLFVALICPWASRTLLVRAIKGLEDVISISIVEPQITKQGWKFGNFAGATGHDKQIGAEYVHQLYTHSEAHYTGRATVPILWDKKTKTIVNNESADIIQILNSSFNEFSNTNIDLRPNELLPQISSLNNELYEQLNNGVYKAGFASSQLAYEEAFEQVFRMLDKLDGQLADGRKYLLGEQLTESDIRTFVTLIRFDIAYFGLFKCNLKRIVDYKYLQPYMLRILALPNIKNTVSVEHIKAGYYSVKALNPSGIIPVGPDISQWRINDENA